MTVFVKLIGAQLALTSSNRHTIETEGRLDVRETSEGVFITERLPADELRPSCRVVVPKGTVLDIDLERGGLRVFDFAGTVRARLRSGAAKLDHLEGRFRVVSDDGAISFEEVRGVVDVLTSNGTIAARHVQGEVQAVSQNGSMEFEVINGPLVARSITGTLDAKEISGMARLSTRSGPINVTSSYRQLTVRTQTGDIALNGSVVDHTTLETSRGSVEVRLGRATDARIEAQARQGVVRSERLALAPGSARRRVRSALGTGRARLRVETGMGVIELAGPMPAPTPVLA